MKKIQKISTLNVYPIYDKREGNAVYNINDDRLFHFITIETHIRKKHRGTWYLIPVRISSRTEFKDLADNTNLIKEANESLMNQFIAEVYCIIMFYKIPRLKEMISERPIIYIDADQKDEKERVLPGLILPKIE